MKKILGTFFLVSGTLACATEILHPVLPPQTRFSTGAAAELRDDVYSADMHLSAEFAPGKNFSIYADGSFRFLSYSYEYSRKGYIHNYCNLHVNGFNETYLGIKIAPFHEGALRPLGINISWRFPPGEGSQTERFHRLGIEPFYAYAFSDFLMLGAAFRYNRFLEQDHYAPGDEIGARLSFSWKFSWDTQTKTGWIFDEVFLWQARTNESENQHLAKPYRKMKDNYQGIRTKFEVARYFSLFSNQLGFGLNYEINQGTLFGFETGHRLGLFINIR